MREVFAQTFPGGSVEDSVTSITLANNTAKTQDKSVETDTLWVVENIKITNPDDVQRNVRIEVYKEAAKTNLICYLKGTTTLAAGATLNIPTKATASTEEGVLPMTLGPGNTISVYWAAGGASTGGTDADGLVIHYRKLPLT